jgi:hypothetical protein
LPLSGQESDVGHPGYDIQSSILRRFSIQPHTPPRRSCFTQSSAMQLFRSVCTAVGCRPPPSRPPLTLTASHISHITNRGAFTNVQRSQLHGGDAVEASAASSSVSESSVRSTIQRVLVRWPSTGAGATMPLNAGSGPRGRFSRGSWTRNDDVDESSCIAAVSGSCLRGSGCAPAEFHVRPDDVSCECVHIVTSSNCLLHFLQQTAMNIVRCFVRTWVSNMTMLFSFGFSSNTSSIISDADLPTCAACSGSYVVFLQYGHSPAHCFFWFLTSGSSLIRF